MDEDERRLQLITDQTQCCRSSFVISPSSLDEDDDDDDDAGWERNERKKLFRMINKCLELRWWWDETQWQPRN